MRASLPYLICCSLIVGGAFLFLNGCNEQTDLGQADQASQSGTPTAGIMHDDSLWPLYYEPLDWLNESRFAFRNHEEESAAHQLRKAVAWMAIAAADSRPNTKAALDAAAFDLGAIARDLEQHNAVAASRLDLVVARASRALAAWHYFKAEQAGSGREDEIRAARNLTAAARYLRYAAQSSNYQYGPEVALTIEDLDRLGNDVETTVIEPNLLAQDLSSVSKELQKMETVLNAPPQTTQASDQDSETPDTDD